MIHSNQYYPFGMLFAESSNQDKQYYKYNGKELDQMHGLNQYDYAARYYDPGYGRFTSVDPLSEKYYSWSPYVYCLNNPLRHIDPTGMWVDDIYYNETGTEIYRVKNDKPDKAFVIKTTRTTDDMYPDKGPQKGNAKPISSDAASTTENQIAEGNLIGDHMKNVVALGPTSNMEAMVASVKDDGTGGTSAENNREYSGNLGT